MRWQKTARLAIAAFVIAFTAFVFVALRRPGVPAEPEGTPRTNPDAVSETREGTFRSVDMATGKVRYEVDFESQVAYADGRTVLKNAVITLPDRGGRTVKIRAGEMEAVTPPGGDGELSLIKAWSGVTLEASDGLEVTAEEATYDDGSGFLNVPGDVRFTRGRMTGSGVGATYNRDLDVLWLLDRARIDVKPDETGAGAAQASAKAAGLARAEHYVRLTENATITSDGQTLDALDITIHLTPDDRAIRSVALRGDSRIRGAGGGAESMSARDIDLTYAPDGRTLQDARLMENAQVSFAGEAAPRRVSGRSIDLALGPDGATVTTLNASGDVRLDLPPEGDVPAREIAAPVLKAGGPEGLQTATFSGGTTYREQRAPSGASTGERTARAQTLVVETQPGLGAITRADFRGNVRIEDGATTAEGRRAIYRVAEDRFELVPSPDDPGPASSVNDGRVNVSARTVSFSMATQQLVAEHDVRSSLQPARPAAKPAPAGQGGVFKQGREDGGKLPALLKDGEPVNVTSSRLEYDGAEGVGTYTGNALLFQNKTSIRAETIVLDDRQANLTGRGNVRTVMFLEETDAETKSTRLVQTLATGDTMVYEDATRLATYTTGPTAKAHLVGSQGDVTAERIRLFLQEETNQLDRAEADGNVILKEGPRVATGDHLTYTPADETYLMTGRPVEIEERTPGDCRVTIAASVTFHKTANDMRVKANGVLPIAVRQCTAK